MRAIDFVLSCSEGAKRFVRKQYSIKRAGWEERFSGKNFVFWILQRGLVGAGRRDFFKCKEIRSGKPICRIIRISVQPKDSVCVPKIEPFRKRIVSFHFLGKDHDRLFRRTMRAAENRAAALGLAFPYQTEEQSRIFRAGSAADFFHLPEDLMQGCAVFETDFF